MIENSGELSVAYQQLASNSRGIVAGVAHDIAIYLRSLDSAQLLRLSERFREYSSMEWRIWWEKVDLSFWKSCITSREDFLWIVRLGTFHPNGYFREKCIRELAGDGASVRFVLLRLNDWAVPVREAAEAVSAYITKLSAEDLVACLPYLEKVKLGSRRDNKYLQKLEKDVADCLQVKLSDVDIFHLNKYDVKARKYLYRVLLERRLLTKEEIDVVLAREKFSQCQLLIMTLLLTNYECSVEELDSFLKHKSKVVQKKALEQKYHLLGDSWEGLEEMLLASSIGVRSMVSYILRKHTEVDIIAYYVEHLESPQKKICILGIGEYGSAGDAEILMPYLESSDEGIVKNTIHALSLLLRDGAGEIFWKYLLDERPVVMRAAYREIAANSITYGAKQVYEVFLQTDSSLLKEKLAYQLLRERSWDRLPYVLQLYWYEEPVIREILQRGAAGRNMYARISGEAAEHIRNILYNAEYGIPEKLAKSIEFDLKFVTVV